MTTYNIRQMRFNEGRIREVDVPVTTPCDIEDLLGLIFEYGQNIIQPKPSPSVSVGDIIELSDGNNYIIKPIGFERLEKDTYNLLINSLRKSIELGGVGENRYDNILWSELGKESMNYC